MGGKKKDRKNAKKGAAKGRSQQSAEDESNPPLADLHISSPSEVESNPDESDYTESDSVTDSASKASSPPLLSPSSDKSDLEKQPSPDDINNLEDFPKRTESTLGSTCPNLAVYVNYFEIKIDPKITTYNQYSVDIKMVKTGREDKDCPKALRWKAMEAYRLKFMPGRHPAYDGDQMMIATKPLRETAPDETVTLEDIQTEEGITLKINVNNVNKKVKLESIRQFANEKTKVAPQEAMQSLDWILRQAGNSNHLKVGRNFYTGELSDLKDGMALWQGLFQSTYLGRCGDLSSSSNKPKKSTDKDPKLYLNVDAVYKAFARPQSIENLAKVLNNELPQQTTGNNRNQSCDFTKLQNYLKGLKIIYSVPKTAPQRKIVYIVREVAQSANNISFIYGEKRVTVAEYMHKAKEYRLQHADWPCLAVGSRDKTLYLPVELCSVAKNQVTTKRLNEKQKNKMIEGTLVKPGARKQMILDQLNRLNLNQNPCMKEFGITVETSMTSVAGWHLSRPPLTEHKKNTVHFVTNTTCWKLNKLASPSNIIKSWAMVDLLENSSETITYEQQQLFNDVQAQLFVRLKLGVFVKIKPDYYWPKQEVANKMDLREFLRTLAPKKYDLVIIFIHGKIDGEDSYGTIKQMMDQELKLVSQCILRSRVIDAHKKGGSPESPVYYQIMLKINAKMGGTNYGIEELAKNMVFQPRTMIMGADVTHPGAGSTNVASFAAVSGKIDRDSVSSFLENVYHMNWRVQPPREEIIADLKEMTKEHILFYYKHSTGTTANQKKPQYIIFYRDGVSDTQFAEVKRKEVKAIQEACKEVAAQNRWEAYKPIIIFLVVQKRNHARFFPKISDDSNTVIPGVDPTSKNVKPGFFVDTVITHPWQMDFFLVSQIAAMGTACPARYRLLHRDETKLMNDDIIKKMTYYLCFLYTRCNKSVSYPAPTYYAHLAAARVKLYCNNKFDNIDTSAER
ncbi:Hypothetical predicted protein [Cloeon dipterum]|uniref:Piwi domain-containing protein n=1 Tax=Cloeon dipterum TaxID=197152 RepID=A0A8S1DGN2_9INSE|nr:Hypothetical predicted protein [Cloeon dipterum]